jgi:hypothetical protein
MRFDIGVPQRQARAPLTFPPIVWASLIDREKQRLVAAPAAFGVPVTRLLESLARIGLEYDPFARPPAARIHLVMEPSRELLFVVMRIALRSEVDVALGEPQCTEIFSDVVRVRIPSDIDAIMNVEPMILRNPSCSKK